MLLPPESTEYPISTGRINSSELIYLFHQHLNYLVNVFNLYRALINSAMLTLPLGKE